MRTLASLDIGHFRLLIDLRHDANALRTDIIPVQLLLSHFHPDFHTTTFYHNIIPEPIRDS